LHIEEQELGKFAFHQADRAYLFLGGKSWMVCYQPQYFATEKRLLLFVREYAVPLYGLFYAKTFYQCGAEFFILKFRRIANEVFYVHAIPSSL
jgi:hypothetical protein